MVFSNGSTSWRTNRAKNAPKHLKTSRNVPYLHNNMRRLGSIRNQQVNGSSPFGSSFHSQDREQSFVKLCAPRTPISAAGNGFAEESCLPAQLNEKEF